MKLLSLLSFLLFTTISLQLTARSTPVKITVVVPSYNNELWYHKNLLSIAKQSYKHWNVIYINDRSTDKTGELVEKFIKDYQLNDKFTVVHNKKRLGSLRNIYNTVSKIDPFHVVVLVDGDDWLADSDVFKHIAKIYRKDCRIWLTYGNFIISPSNQLSHCKKYPKSVIKKCAFRNHSFLSSHLKTFYAGLFHLIKEADLKDENNKFFPSSGDVAFMLPMLEMASLKHTHFVSKILYVYNHSNPLSDHLNQPLQQLCHDKIKAKPKYKPLTHAPWKDNLIIPLLMRNKIKE